MHPDQSVSPPERRRVSMLHEYGHLLLSTDRYRPGIDYLSMPGRKQLGLVPRGTWDHLSESGFAPRFKAESLLGLSCQPLDDDVVPERYRYLAVCAYERGELGEKAILGSTGYTWHLPEVGADRDSIRQAA